MTPTASPTQLCASIASIISDYREGEIARPDAAHVEAWINQFPQSTRLPVLQEVAHILGQTYFSKARVVQWLQMLCSATALVGNTPHKFWSNAAPLRLQTRGQSQEEMLNLLQDVVSNEFDTTIGATTQGGPFLYLDDFIFTGNTVLRDLREWIASSAPSPFELHIVAIAVHSYGAYYLEKRLRDAASKAGKTIDQLQIWRSATFEDRRAYTDDAEVLRPSMASGDPHVDQYVSQLTAEGYPPVLRKPGAMPSSGVFMSSTSRDVLEWEFLKTGAQFLAECTNPSRMMRPLGYSFLSTLGFGALVATYRNCPNNCPLAFWWGDPTASSGALAWYPLLPRKTYVERSLTSFAALLQRALHSDVTNLKQTDTPESQPVSSFPDDDELLPLWEDEALTALQRAVESLVFDMEEGEIVAPTEDGNVRITSYEDLEYHLTEIYNEAWYVYVPFDGGCAVFEDDSWWVVSEALEKLVDDLRRLGWVE